MENNRASKGVRRNIVNKKVKQVFTEKVLFRRPVENEEVRHLDMRVKSKIMFQMHRISRQRP